MGLPVYDMPRAAVDLVLFQRRSVVESSGNSWAAERLLRLRYDEVENFFRFLGDAAVRFQSFKVGG